MPQMFVQASSYLDLPREPQPWIIDKLIPVGGLVNVFGKPKSGKALALTTPIPTPIGWTVLGALRPGDRVFGASGVPCTVQGISPTWADREVYTLTFADGSTVLADAEHEWVAQGRHSGKIWSGTVTTAHMVQKGVTNASGAYRKMMWSIPLPGPLQYPPTDQLIDPYLLGCWLGDGTSIRGEMTSADSEIIDAFRQRYKVTKRASPYGYGIRGFQAQLRVIGVLGNKHIPSTYLIASIEQRKALLQGLMDTDGTVGRRGGAEFDNTNKRLADGVAQLAKSLGYRVTKSARWAQAQTGNPVRCYRVRISAHQPIFRLARKRLRQALHTTERYLSIKSIEAALSVPVRCIQVDSPEHCFLAGESCIPTHNSFFMLGAVEALANGAPEWQGFAIRKHGPVAYLQVDTPREEWATRVARLKWDHAEAADRLWIADMWQVPEFPFNILNPQGHEIQWLKDNLARIQPVVVVIDTLREIHAGDENDSTVMRNVVANLVGACRPAAIVLVSHSRKDSVMTHSGDDDLMDQQRGSSYISGRMDVIIKISPKRLTFKGRATGQQTYPIIQDERGFLCVERGSQDAFDDAYRVAVTQHPDDSDNRLAERIALATGGSQSNAYRKVRQRRAAGR